MVENIPSVCSHKSALTDVTGPLATAVFPSLLAPLLATPSTLVLI